MQVPVSLKGKAPRDAVGPPRYRDIVTTDYYTPQGDYHSIRSAAVNRIDHYEREATRTPFDPKQFGVHARVLKKGLDTHITADESVGSACVACGRPWPCSSIQIIFVPVSVLD